MTLSGVTQRYLADPRRGDGHDAQGNPGDCLAACIATLLGHTLEDVPNCGIYVSWFARARLYVRATTDMDLGYWADPASIIGHDRTGISHGQYGIGAGPSPRGRFLHAVVIDLDTGATAWDPHPSRDGVDHLVDVIALVDPWLHPPYLAALGCGTPCPTSGSRGVSVLLSSSSGAEPSHLAVVDG